MQTVELNQREIKVILAMLYNCGSRPLRLCNGFVDVSYVSDLQPLIRKFDAMLRSEEIKKSLEETKKKAQEMGLLDRLEQADSADASMLEALLGAFDKDHNTLADD